MDEPAVDVAPMQVDDSSYRKGSELVKRYFQQLTVGCGRKGCPNQHCLSCPDGPGRLEPAQAALLSLELAQGAEHHLCEDEPPFLHVELVQELASAASRTSDMKPVMKEVAAVFSNSDALNRSFLQSRAQLREAAASSRMPESELSGLDTGAIVESYHALLQLQSNEVLNALMNAAESLLCKLQVAQLAQPSFVADGPSVRQFVVLMHNPLLLEPQFHNKVLLPLLSLISVVPDDCAASLVRWWSLLPPMQLGQMVSTCQQFITVRLYHTQRIDDAVIAGTRVLGQLFEANERAVADGRRGHKEALEYQAFYNDAINQEVNLKEDYRRWKSNRGEFSFCQHPFVLEPSSKSRVLMYDATAQMTHEFEGAILRSLFVGATSPYLVIKVRRAHLINDTLLQMGLRKDDLKKPLKVQFVGEEGIDEGGVQKEFFQLIMGQIFDVNYGMFTYDEARPPISPRPIRCVARAIEPPSRPQQRPPHRAPATTRSSACTGSTGRR